MLNNSFFPETLAIFPCFVPTKAYNAFKTENLPGKYKEEFIYNPPSRGTPSGHAHVRNFEKDKPALEEIRFKDFFRDADDFVNDYLLNVLKRSQSVY
jgi:hypothetical protein